MSQVFTLALPEETALRAAEEALAAGELVVLPTDTVYGVAARPDVQGGTARLFEAKARPHDLTLPILVPDADDAAVVARLDDRARALAAEFWPGGLTMVLPRTERAAAWDLGAATTTVGVRVPDDPVTLALLARVGPLAVTSANISGQPTPSTCGGVQEQLGDAVAVYLCAGPAPGGVPSTVVDLTERELRALRQGAIPEQQLLATLGDG